jgi:hypothetical protein
MIIPTYCCGEWRTGRCTYCPVLRAREKAIHSVEDHTQQWWRVEAFKAADRVMRRMTWTLFLRHLVGAKAT